MRWRLRTDWHENHSTKKILVATILLIGGLYSGTIITLNHLTRIDAAQHVSNMPCGIEYMTTDGGGDTCPGEMQCFGGFDWEHGGDRLTVEPAGARCVTPAYREHYCGVFAKQAIGQSDPPVMAECGVLFSPTRIAERIQQPLFWDRLRFSFQDEAARIDQYNLSLAVDDPNAKQVDVTEYGVIDCSDGNLTITETVFHDRNNTAVVTVANTGTVTIPNISLFLFSNNGAQNHTNINQLGTETVKNTTIAGITEPPERVRITSQHCPGLSAETGTIKTG
jgi:hypothetical protein